MRQIGTEAAFTTDHVVLETWSILKRRLSHSHANKFWFALRYLPLKIEIVGIADLERAQAIAESWADQQFDFVDCTSFAVTERLGCERVASFDHDFAVYRFGPDRKRAFEILS